ncbi:MAG: Rpn family recombination-promoting nuclease/putative transposase, partial [Myxococcota bacterium]
MSFQIHPHDQMFAVGADHEPVVKAFLRKHLHSDLKAAAEFDGLEMLSGAFVDASRRLRADAVFRLPLRGGGYLMPMVEQE